MDELAYLNAGLTIHMVDMRKPVSKSFKTVAALTLEDPEDSSSKKIEVSWWLLRLAVMVGLMT